MYLGNRVFLKSSYDSCGFSDQHQDGFFRVVSGMRFEFFIAV